MPTIQRFLPASLWSLDWLVWWDCRVYSAHYFVCHSIVPTLTCFKAIYVSVCVVICFLSWWRCLSLHVICISLFSYKLDDWGLIYVLLSQKYCYEPPSCVINEYGNRLCACYIYFHVLMFGVLYRIKYVLHLIQYESILVLLTYSIYFYEVITFLNLSCRSSNVWKKLKNELFFFYQDSGLGW